jgi:hypothetical protein
MAKKAGTEVDKLTKVAERLFLLHGKGIRFSTDESGRLVLEYTTDYRPTRLEHRFLMTEAERILFLLPFWRVKLFHSVMTPRDIQFLNSCNINLELSENSELRSPVAIPTFETAE